MRWPADVRTARRANGGRMCDNENACAHFEHSRIEVLESYAFLHNTFVVAAEPACKAVKIKNGFCHVCKRRAPSLHTCMECIFFGCLQHMREHSVDAMHVFALDLIYGQVHCSACEDYIYHPQIDDVALRNIQRAARSPKRLLRCCSWYESTWVENYVKSKRVFAPNSTLGLRGLVNFGKSCFMNVIIQTFIHMPVMRAYFLSERHKCDYEVGTCVICELAWIYQECYKDITLPLTVEKLFFMIWNFDKTLSGNEYHDAHELFMAVINYMRKQWSDKHSIPANIAKIPCVVDQVFYGELQSDLTCPTCKSVTTRVEPMWGCLQLGLAPTQDGSQNPSTLIDCLYHFTKVEVMEEYKCTHCPLEESIVKLTNQTTIKALPIVLCFQLKRFEQYNKIYRKSTAKITFPEMLDMTPFTTASKKAVRPVIPNDNRYFLFSVVRHNGNLTVGHYTAFIRHFRNAWYLCHDQEIYKVQRSDVLNTDGYLLFYHKHILDYD